MRTFNEWMDVRSSNKPLRDWTFITKAGLDEAKSFLAEEGENLFRDLEVVESSTHEGQTVISLRGDPMVTIFELEALGITAN